MRFQKVVALSVGLLMWSTVDAQGPAVVKRDGHVSPVQAVITTASGAKRDVTIVGFGMAVFLTDANKHVVVGFDADSGGKVTLWLDELREIRSTSPEDYVAILKNGQVRHLKYAGSTDCTTLANHINRDTECAFIHTAQNAEIIDIAKLKAITFAAPGKKDSAGNAMLDEWKFSPFTGEKLP